MRIINDDILDGKIVKTSVHLWNKVRSHKMMTNNNTRKYQFMKI